MGGPGLAFGAGAGESLFGARAGNVLSKATVVLGIVFLASTLFLGILFAQQDKGIMDDVVVPAAQPASMQMQPIDPDNLVIPTDTVLPAVATPEEAAIEVKEETMEVVAEPQEEM